MVYAADPRRHDGPGWVLWNGPEAEDLVRDGVSSQSGLLLLSEEGVPKPPTSSKARAVTLAVKRGLDILLSVAGIVALAPLLVATSAAIKLSSSGPVLFPQRRIGWRGRPFLLLKFRTMYAERGDQTGVSQTRPGDDRVTPIGRFLRKTSLDELPQLFNVLVGDMSLVGPRPHVEGQIAAGVDYRKLVPYYSYRYLVRPGITGWAQANGLRGPTDDAELSQARIDHDAAYIQHVSIALDLYILVKTIKGEFLSGNGV
jgi:polysaccharide biosynthesis protein PslA